MSRQDKLPENTKVNHRARLVDPETPAHSTRPPIILPFVPPLTSKGIPVASVLIGNPNQNFSLLKTYRPIPAASPSSPPVALLLQQIPEGLEVPYIGCIMEPCIFTVLQWMVTELLSQPLLQIRTCRTRGAPISVGNHQQGQPNRTQSAVAPSCPATQETIHKKNLKGFPYQTSHP